MTLQRERWQKMDGCMHGWMFNTVNQHCLSNTHSRRVLGPIPHGPKCFSIWSLPALHLTCIWGAAELATLNWPQAWMRVLINACLCLLALQPAGDLPTSHPTTAGKAEEDFYTLTASTNLFEFYFLNKWLEKTEMNWHILTATTNIFLPILSD